MAKSYSVRARLIVMGSVEGREETFPLLAPPARGDMDGALKVLREYWRAIYLEQQKSVTEARNMIDRRYDPEAGRE